MAKEYFYRDYRNRGIAEEVIGEEWAKFLSRKEKERGEKRNSPN